AVAGSRNNAVNPRRTVHVTGGQSAGDGAIFAARGSAVGRDGSIVHGIDCDIDNGRVRVQRAVVGFECEAVRTVVILVAFVGEGARGGIEVGERAVAWAGHDDVGQR